uniref:Putative membrane protein n=1 Tax=Rhipicephalus microplus TaxID=6941 RepID=A0A6G5AGE3_RHIMP
MTLPSFILAFSSFFFFFLNFAHFIKEVIISSILEAESFGFLGSGSFVVLVNSWIVEPWLVSSWLLDAWLVDDWLVDAWLGGLLMELLQSCP